MRMSYHFRPLATPIVLGALCGLIAVSGCRATKPASASPPAAVQPQPDPIKEALAKVEEGRAESTGREVKIDVPAELRHYSDRRRFLAVQTAQETQARLTLPHDYSELSDLVHSGELVEMPILGDDYVLYGVGENATDEPFTHYDAGTGLSVALCTSDEDFNVEAARLSGLVEDAMSAIEQLQKEARSLGRRERSKRRAVNFQIAATRRHILRIKAQRALLVKLSSSPESREMLRAEKKAIDKIASSFEGQTYDLGDADSRRQLKMRLLRFMRPEARTEMLAIARQYHQQFNRPLPVTSLVRTEEYQRRLSEWNRNAARNASPPHVTGLAFDVYYRFMTYGEQEYLMTIIANLKREGRIEALRETRDHIHVFAFTDGQPPDETLVAKAISESRLAKVSTRATSRRGRVRGGN
jgi:hypothetical protein